MKRLQVFNTNPEYNSAKDIFKYPTVAHIKENLDTKFMNEEEYYSKQYLTFEALEDCVFTFSVPGAGNQYGVNFDFEYFAYSIDEGNTWTTTIISSASTTITTTTISKGKKVLWKGIGTTFYTSYGPGVKTTFSSTGKYKIYGNINSLSFSDNFIENNTCCTFGPLFLNNDKLISVKNLILPANNLISCCYYSMFSGCTSLINSPKLNASILANNCYGGMFRDCSSLIEFPILLSLNLASSCYSYMFSGCTSLTAAPKLPAIIIYSNCYQGMFNECTSLINPPKLPAKILQISCYAYMFRGCSSLVNAPELPATEMKPYCYAGMFSKCTSLVNAPKLSSIILDDYCYAGMFSECTSLVNAPELPATEMKPYCYGSIYTGQYETGGMFKGCTSLISAPELPSTTLANYCYQSMFQDCTSLVNAPELPATILSIYCYYRMFYGCTSLVNAPELLADTLVQYCYCLMFNGCSNLQYIKMLATNISAVSCLSTWVNGVAATGTFIKSTSATWNVYGINGIPSGWTIDYLWPENTNYFTSTAVEDCTFSLYIPKGISSSDYSFVEYSLDDGQTWVRTNNVDNQNVLAITPTISSGNSVKWRGLGKFLSTSAYHCTFSTNYDSEWGYTTGGIFDISNDLSSMIGFSNGYDSSGYPYNYTFRSLFLDACVRNAKDLILYSENLPIGCYKEMFYLCQYLISTPNLPAIILSNNCYDQMFKSCTSLVNPPILPATTLASHCYENMFANCTALNVAPILPATIVQNYCYYSMFEGCTSLITAPALPATNSAESCYCRMFYGCTSLVNIPSVLPGAPLVSRCYWQMFEGCTSITTAPELPYYTVSFSPQCYARMFYGCSSLNYIKALFDYIASNSSYTENWVYGVAQSGTFIKSIDATWNITGVNGVPTGWTIEPGWPNNYNYLTTEAIDNCIFTFSIPETVNTSEIIYIEYSIDNGQTWIRTNNINNQSITISTPTISSGNSVKWRGNAIRTSTTSTNASSFSASGRYNISGNIMSIISSRKTFANAFDLASLFENSRNLINANNLILPLTTLSAGCYEDMFRNCSSLVTAPELPATTLALECYKSMFYGCTSLTTAPELPATTLAERCYQSMFRECTSLINIPTLSATNLVTNCYKEMFYRCSRLNYIYALFTTTPSDSYTQNWVYGVASSGTFKKGLNATWNVIGTNGIPSGWTVEETIVYMGMWIDDFPGLVQVENALNDPELAGNNKYQYCGDTIMYNNQTCYLCAADDDTVGAGAPPYLLLSTNNYNTIRNQSIAWSGYDTQFSSLVAFLQYDYNTLYDSNSSNVQNTKLISFNTTTEVLWIDDFKTLPSYDFVNDPEGMGSNYYEYFGETMVFNNQTCYIWANGDSGNGAPEYILTSTGNYQTLYNQSMEYAYNEGDNIPTFGAFVAALSSDMSLQYDNTDYNWGSELRLIKVEDFRSPLMILWIDDYPDDGDGTLDGDPIEDLMDYAIANPDMSGANKYVYYGETIEYDGDTYYLWNAMPTQYNTPQDYILTTTDDYNTLRNQSIEVSGYNTQFTALAVKMNKDNINVYEGEDVEDQQLIKISQV